MAEIVDAVREWASTVTAALCVALVVGGLTLHSDVQRGAVRLEAVTVLAQATDAREQALERSMSGVDAKLEGLRRDIDRVADAVEQQANDAANDRALILQELGRLQGRTDSPDRRQ